MQLENNYCEIHYFRLLLKKIETYMIGIINDIVVLNGIIVHTEKQHRL